MKYKLKHDQALDLIKFMENAHCAEVVVDYIKESTEDLDLARCPFCGTVPLMDELKRVCCVNYSCAMFMKPITHSAWQTRWSPEEDWLEDEK